jgi:hypothetical protein
VVFEKLFKRRHKFLVRLAKRGNSTVLGVVEGSNANEVYEMVIEMLQNREDAREWPIIRIMNTETGVEVKFPNPFAPEEEYSGSKPGRGRGGSLLEELADETVKQNILGAFTFFTQLNAMTTKTLAEAYGEALKSIVSSISPPPTSNPQPQQLSIPYQLPTGGSNLRDIAELVKAIVMLYQVWSANPKAFDSFIQSRIQRFLGIGGGVMMGGGENVEPGGAPGEHES